MLIRLHPASALMGVGALAAVLLVLGAFQQPMPIPIAEPLRVEYVPHPGQMVQIAGGQPYTVPSGHILTITAIGAVEQLSGLRTVVKVNDESVVEGGTLTGVYPSMVAVPQGLTIQAGATVTLDENGGSSSQVPQLRAWGYLVPCPAMT